MILEFGTNKALVYIKLSPFPQIPHSLVEMLLLSPVFRHFSSLKLQYYASTRDIKSSILKKSEVH